MKPENILKVCGSITKKESLIQLKENTLKRTVVAEANLPYANYYGRVPASGKPNSIFLFTDRYYTLEETLRFTQSIDICAKNEVNVASAFMQFKTHRYPAIRIRDFPDYEHLKMLEECYIDQGVKFARKITMEPEALVTVNKCFFLEEKEDGIFMDQNEKDEGYITVSQYLDPENFESLMHDVWNNANCRAFDAAMGGFIIDGRVINIIRIYSEHLDMKTLHCIQEEVRKQMTRQTSA